MFASVSLLPFSTRPQAPPAEPVVKSNANAPAQLPPHVGGAVVLVEVVVGVEVLELDGGVLVAVLEVDGKMMDVGGL
jgi:hypothetical protein